MKPEFNLAKKGYDMRQVDTYIDHIRGEYERLVKLSEQLYNKSQKLESMLTAAGVPTGNVAHSKPEPKPSSASKLPPPSKPTPAVALPNEVPTPAPKPVSNMAKELEQITITEQPRDPEPPIVELRPLKPPPAPREKSLRAKRKPVLK